MNYSALASRTVPALVSARHPSRRYLVQAQHRTMDVSGTQLRAAGRDPGRSKRFHDVNCCF